MIKSKDERKDVSKYLSSINDKDVLQILMKAITYEETYKQYEGDYYKYSESNKITSHTNQFWIERLVKVLADKQDEFLINKFDGIRFVYNKLTLIHFKNDIDHKYEIIINCNKVKEIVYEKNDSSDKSKLIVVAIIILSFVVCCILSYKS